ncbi:unnamed protein product, partial [Didymodactylos carnosus]
MTSNKAKRYLQNKIAIEQHTFLSPPLSTTHQDVEQQKRSYKFTSRRTSYQKQDLIPPIICVDKSTDNEQEDDDDDVDDVDDANSILDEFDRVLDNELIMPTSNVHRTFSLKQQSQEHLAILNQPRSFSFALGSSTTNLDDSSSSSSSTASSTSSPVKLNLPSQAERSNSGKTSLSKETFSRLLASLAFRQTKRPSINRTVQTSQTCLSCQNQTYLQLQPKHKKRPSIFGVLVAKLSANTDTSTSDSPTSKHCHLCKKGLTKSIFYNQVLSDDQHSMSTSSVEQQPQKPDIESSSPTVDINKNYSSSSLSKKSRLNLNTRTKRRRSLPSLFHSLFDSDSLENKSTRLIIDSSSSSQRLSHHHQQQLPSFSSILTNSLLDSIARDTTTNRPLTKVRSTNLLNQKITITTAHSSSSSISSISSINDDDNDANVTTELKHHITKNDNQATDLQMSLNGGQNINNEMNNQRVEEKKGELGLVKVKTPEQVEAATMAELNAVNSQMSIGNDGLLSLP